MNRKLLRDGLSDVATTTTTTTATVTTTATTEETDWLDCERERKGGGVSDLEMSEQFIITVYTRV